MRAIFVAAVGIVLLRISPGSTTPDPGGSLATSANLNRTVDQVTGAVITTGIGGGGTIGIIAGDNTSGRRPDPRPASRSRPPPEEPHAAAQR